MELCPVCGLLTPLQLLESHVNKHFDQPPGRRSTRQVPGITAARCTVCGEAIPLVELDAHERAHESSSPRHRASSANGVASVKAAGNQTGHPTAAATPPAAPPSPSTSSDVVILSAPSSPNLSHHVNGATGNQQLLREPAAAAGAATRVAAATAPSAGAGAGAAGAACLPSVVCPYGCGQWIPVSELDSHELAHRIAGPLGRRNADAVAVAAAAPQPAASVATDSSPTADAASEDDWMQAGFNETDFYDSYGEDVIDDAVAAAVADEEAARRLQEEQDFEALRAKYGFSSKRPGRCYACGHEGHWANECPQRGRAPQQPPARLSTAPALLVEQQRPDPQARRPPGAAAPRLLQHLKACLEGAAGAPDYQAFLCCPLQHFSAAGGDRGWGCGWRNIQMLSSALLLRDERLRGALYGGTGFVPDIASLQAWLESAWAAGFDPLGCESLGGRIQGDRKWIGTTEAAALLRSFGISAQIVDFEGAGSGVADADAAAPGSVVPDPAGGGVMHLAIECDLCGVCPIRGVRHRSLSRPNFDICAACRASGRPDVAAAAPYEETGIAASARASGNGPGRQPPPPPPPKRQPRHPSSAQGHHLHQPLVDWVWNYFSGQHRPTSSMWAPPPQHHPGGPRTAAGACTGGGDAGGNALGGAAASAGGGVGPVRGGSKGAGSPREAGGSGSGGGSTGGAAAAAAGAPGLPLRSSPVIITGMPPLYFQHEGHSRTIIGIERRRERAGGPQITTLLVLDPGALSAALETALAQRRPGWQRFVRRGLQSLTRPQYQLMYVDLAAGVAPEGGAGREVLKVVSAVEKYKAPAGA